MRFNMTSRQQFTKILPMPMLRVEPRVFCTRGKPFATRLTSAQEASLDPSTPRTGHLDRTHPRRSLKSIQPRENQSALLSYGVPFCNTSGAMYPWVPLGREGRWSRENAHSGIRRTPPRVERAVAEHREESMHHGLSIRLMLSAL